VSETNAAEEAGSLTVEFWGVRGSIACPGPDTVRYGGNTSCVEVRCGDHLIIFDAGTGLRPLGNALEATGKPIDADLFFSHSHIDHISGIPFFSPLYSPKNSFRVWAGHLRDGRSMANVFADMMQDTMFPVSPAAFQAKPEFRNFHPGETLSPAPGITIRTAPLNHPGGATGYRLDYNGKSVAYLTDTEHRIGAPDQNILRLAAGADIMIYDSTYTDEEFPSFIGWGHSTWEEGVRLADACGAKTLVIFHHDPSHEDTFMDRIATEAYAARHGTQVAQERMVLRP